MMRHVICTLGSSLVGRINGWNDSQARQGNPEYVARILNDLDPADPRCGAEINSMADVGVEDQGRLHLLHSDTDEGRLVARILRRYYELRGWDVDEPYEITGLTDQDPKQFRTVGLRSMVTTIAGIFRKHGAERCIINATGGYKAQVAVAVMMGQTFGVPVHYKHEKFNESITFPPLPFSLDMELWVKYDHVFNSLGDPRATVTMAELGLECVDPRLNYLLESEAVDGHEVLCLSVAGQIFHETMKVKFHREKGKIMPPTVSDAEKIPVRLRDHGWPNRDRALLILSRVARDPYVVTCTDSYLNRDLSKAPGFFVSGGEVMGRYSDGTWTMEFRVHTRAQTDMEKYAVVEHLSSISESFFG